jgi:type III restriction enzyme
MNERLIASIAGRLSLREPQRKSLELLAQVAEMSPPSKETDLKTAQDIIKSAFPSVTDFERDFPSLCFALATGVGKTRLMGAFITYLHLAYKVNHFFVLAPNLTIYNKLIADFTPNTPKYVFKGIAEFSQDPPQIITGDNYERADVARTGSLIEVGIQVNIFNISKINSEVRGGKAPRIKRLSEYIGESYFEYLANLPDLVLLMDESHRYRASAGIKAINELKPTMGLELTATPFVESGKNLTPFKNVIYAFPLAEAMESGFVKEPAVVTQKNFRVDQFSESELEQIKLEDGIRIHENTKVELETYARQNAKPIVKPFMLVVSRDTTHADSLQKLMESEAFFGGRYQGKVIQVHSNQQGEEKEEVVQRLLAVEDPNEPTEVVIHVNMLKEGWDVTNLYTIVPLRAANARTLVEQSLGRGLRLPYGKRTGVSAVDTLNIIAHDNFQAIVDEANRGDSVLKMKIVELEPETKNDRNKTVVSRPEVSEPLSTGTPEQKKFAKAVYDIIQEYGHLGASTDLTSPAVQAEILAEAKVRYGADQGELPGMEVIQNPETLVSAVTENVIKKTIDIPRILVIPKGNSTVGFQTFQLNLGSINFQPVSRDLLLQYLRTNEQSTVSFQKGGQDEDRLENYLVRGLIDKEDISYDDHADLLYDLCGQVVRHLRGYLTDDDAVKNVLRYYQRTIVDFIHSQMLAHQSESQVEYEIKVSKGFTPLKDLAFTVPEGAEITDLRRSDFDRSRIGKMIFGGFQKGLYPMAKFDSDTERRFAVILERESQKWLKPAKGQFQIHYLKGADHAEYIPDFVAETADTIYMIETKAKNELEAQEVLTKKKAATAWCEIATVHNRALGKKPWKYLLVSHDQVQDNRTLEYFGSLEL